MSSRTSINADRSMEFYPLTLERWSDAEELFGERGGHGGCWCMYWRLTRREFENQQGERNRQALKGIVQSGRIPGILGYSDGKAIAWCSVAPREEFASLNRSRVLKRIDDAPVWSIICFFVARSHRRRGIAEKLIQAAIKYVREQGGRIVEVYPTIPKSDRIPSVSGYMGFPSMFEKFGFVECAKPSQSRRLMRYYIDETHVR